MLFLKINTYFIIASTLVGWILLVFSCFFCSFRFDRFILVGFVDGTKFQIFVLLLSSIFGDNWPNWPHLSGICDYSRFYYVIVAVGSFVWP